MAVEYDEKRFDVIVKARKNTEVKILKPCPFCGGEAYIHGEKTKEYFDGEWEEGTGERYWVRTACDFSCVYGITLNRAYGEIYGVSYPTPEAAIKAWNRRADNGCVVHKIPGR